MNTFIRILKFSQPYKWLIGISMVSSFFSVLLNSLSIWLIGTVMSNIMSNNSLKISNPESIKEHLDMFVLTLVGEGNNIEQLQSFCILLFIIFLMKNILIYIGKNTLSYVQNYIITDIRIKLFHHINQLSMNFFNKHKSAELTSIFVTDIAGLRNAFSQSLQKLFIEPINILVFTSLLFLINTKLTLLAMLTIPICGVVIIKMGNSIRRKTKRTSIQNAGIINILKESIKGMKIVKAFNLEESMISKFYNENKKFLKLIISQSRLSNLTTPINEMIGIILGIILLWFGGIQVLGNSSMNPDDFMKFILLLFAMLQPIRKLAGVNTQLQIGIASAERVFSILDEQNDIKTSTSTRTIMNFKSFIKFENVDFNYINEEMTILKNINTSIKKGQITAIVGKSGAGKSTFVDLIPRFYDINNGAIYIDNINIKDLKLSALRNLIGLVTQDIILFNDSIKNNIKCGNPNASLKQVEQAAEIANFSEVINNSSEKINTIIGEDGIKLSGGEKQRLSIARAILKNAEILILDEATASLDSEGEIKVYKAIENLSRNKTVIIIAHRLSTIKKADKIIVLKNGELVDEGKHNELIEHSQEYKNIFEEQFQEKSSK